MKKVIINIVILVLLAGLGLSCNQNLNEDSTLTSNKVTPYPADDVQLINSVMVQLELDELINSSDIILTGIVTGIGPVYRGIWQNTQLIFTDVVVETSQLLYGQTSEKVVIQTRGGRIDDSVTIAEDEPEFQLGEEVLLFLKHKPDSSSSANLDLNSFIVTGMLQGKWSYKDSQAVGTAGQYGISELETRIHSLRGSQ